MKPWIPGYWVGISAYCTECQSWEQIGITQPDERDLHHSFICCYTCGMPSCEDTGRVKRLSQLAERVNLEVDPKVPAWLLEGDGKCPR